MGQNSEVINAMHEAIDSSGAGSGVLEYFGDNTLSCFVGKDSRSS